MKLVRFGDRGMERPGLVDASGAVRDASGYLRDYDKTTLTLEGVDRLRGLELASLPLAPRGARIGACVGDIGKIVGVGLNYTDHAKEANLPVPSEPVLFLKATSAISGPLDDIVLPPGAEKIDWEVELGVVIGRPCRHVAPQDGLTYVLGYCVANDVSERSYQFERGGQWDKGKSYDGFAPLGPWIVTKDEVSDAQGLSLWLEVDGKRYQNGNTRAMVFDVAFLVSYISQFMSLLPGDVIVTGTPAGVGLGQKPDPLFLREGQRVKTGVTGLGEQDQRVVRFSA